MARRSKRTDNPAQLAIHIAEDLEKFSKRVSSQDLRRNIQDLIPIGDNFRDLGASLESASSGKARMLGFLRSYTAQPLAARELETIAGIGEWARRLRELRVQDGWPIFSSDTLRQIAEASPDQARDIETQASFSIEEMPEESYILLQDHRDEHSSKSWKTLNAISKENLSIKDKIIKFLKANVGHPVSGEQLRYLAKGKTEWARRTRELRTEEGWPLQTRMQGRPDLPIGYYVLAEDRQAPAHDRKISDIVRSEVLKRDHYRCRYCDWSRDDAHPDDKKQFLELHHLIEHVHGGGNEADNLVTLCNVDHDAVHAKTIILPASWP